MKDLEKAFKKSTHRFKRKRKLVNKKINRH